MNEISRNWRYYTKMWATHTTLGHYLLSLTPVQEDVLLGRVFWPVGSGQRLDQGPAAAVRRGLSCGSGSMIGHYIAALTPEQEDRLLTTQFVARTLVDEKGRRCIRGAVEDWIMVAYAGQQPRGQTNKPRFLWGPNGGCSYSTEWPNVRA